MRIKICGLTRPEEADYLNENQVDFAGFVLFFPKSKRNITLERAKEIMSRLDPKIKTVAVTVSPTKDQIRQIKDAGFHLIQIHGEVEEDVWNTLPLPAWKAFNINDMEYFLEYQQKVQVKGYVFDAHEPGSGKTFDWDMLKNLPRDEKMLILAGGLSPDNVKKAIEYVKPDGVDVSTGVERSGGDGKDKDKIHKFVEEIRKSTKCGGK